MRNGRITGTGKATEKELIAILNGYEVEQKRGDLAFMYNNKEIVIESKSPQKDDFDRLSSALNQVKPYLFNVIVFDARNLNLFDCDFLVFSPLEIFRRTLHRRGQHTSDSLICVNMSVNPSDVQDFGCSTDKLRQRCIAAYNEFVTSDYHSLLTYQIERRIALYRFLDEENSVLAQLIMEKS